jgi:succinoglycan biosynthesis transport protein ExoP
MPGKLCAGVNNLGLISDLGTGRASLNAFRCRKRFVFAMSAAVLLAFVGACGFGKSTYVASSVVQIDGASALSGRDAAFRASNLQARAALLRSQVLALRVIDDLKLQRSDDSSQERHRVVRAFRDRLKVKVIPEAQRLQIEYTDNDPKLAAEVVNHLVDVSADDSVRTTVTSTNPSSRWLEDRLSVLRAQSETLQSKMAASQMLGAPVASDVRNQSIIDTPILAQLKHSAVLLSQARMNSILKASIAEVVNAGDPASISRLSGSSIANAIGDSVRASFIVVNDLIRRQTALEMQTREDAAHLNPWSPQMVRDQVEMRSLQHSMQMATREAAERAQDDLDAAWKLEHELQEKHTVDETVAKQLHDRSIEDAALPFEAELSRHLYQDLLQRLNSAGILTVTRSSDFSVVTRAAVSSSHDHFRTLRYMALAGGFVVFFACCVVLVMDAVQKKRKSEEQEFSSSLNAFTVPPFRRWNSVSIEGSSRTVQPESRGPILLHKAEPLEKPASIFTPHIAIDPRVASAEHPGRLILLKPTACGRTTARP